MVAGSASSAAEEVSGVLPSAHIESKLIAIYTRHAVEITAQMTRIRSRAARMAGRSYAKEVALKRITFPTLLGHRPPVASMSATIRHLVDLPVPSDGFRDQSVAMVAFHQAESRSSIVKAATTNGVSLCAMPSIDTILDLFFDIAGASAPGL